MLEIFEFEGVLHMLLLYYYSAPNRCPLQTSKFQRFWKFCNQIVTKVGHVIPLWKGLELLFNISSHMVAQKLSQLSTIVDFATSVNFLIFFLKILLAVISSAKKILATGES